MQRALLAYGVLGFPLAFAALPLYVHVPRLYAESVGLSLALVGAVLLGARLLDAVVDPLIGAGATAGAAAAAAVAASSCWRCRCSRWAWSAC